MLDVILVDDEEWICSLIGKIVDWKNLGFQIVAEANDGATALELIRQYRPHLVVTDIRMPETDGIALIKQVRELKIKTEFIIISGYSDFEYARSALSFEAYAYLLKPLDSVELVEKLIGVREKILNEHKNIKKSEHINAVLLEKQITSLLSRSYIEEDELALEAYRQEFGLSFNEGLFQVTLLQFDPANACASSLAYHSDIEDFADGVNKSLKAFCFETIVYVKEKMNVIVCLYNYDEKEEERTACLFRDVLKNFPQNKLSEHFDLTIGTGSRTDKITALNEAYFGALNALKARIKLGKGKVLQYADTNNSFKHILKVDDEKKMQALIDVFDIKGFNQLLKNLFKIGDISVYENPNYAFYLAYEIVDFIISAMRKKDIYSSRELTNSYEIFQKFDICTSEQEIIECIGKIFNSYVEKYKIYKDQNGNNRYINTIKNFICENYMHEITLNNAAKLVCLTPVYLSELFKKETGENFIDYLTCYRISIAKGYLKDVKYKVVNVAEFVGYRDPRYFSKLFKKVVGVSPTEYKGMYL